MAGDERTRHCTLCSLNVYNFAEMTREEIRTLLARSEGRVCARLYRRADGTISTKDCPSGIRILRQRMSRLAGAVLAAVVSISTFASGSTTCQKPRVRKHGSTVKLETSRVMIEQRAVFTGVVHDEAGNPLPGVTVTLQEEATRAAFFAVTDPNGAFAITSLNNGSYRVEVTLGSFKPAVVEHLLLKENEVTRASVALRIDSIATVIVGAVAPNPMMTNNGVSTTLSQELIKKLPF